MKKHLLLAALMLAAALLLAGCHGSVDRAEYAVPAEFDTEREY